MAAAGSAGRRPDAAASGTATVPRDGPWERRAAWTGGDSEIAARPGRAADHGFERQRVGVVDDVVARRCAAVVSRRPHLRPVQSNCSPALLDRVPPACMDSARARRSGSLPRLRGLECVC